MTKIKICGIFRDEDTEYINKYRPDYFGMVIDFKKSHRSVSAARAARLRKLVDSDIPAVGVFVNKENSEIEKLLFDGIIDIAQLHGDESAEQIRQLQRDTGKPVWKAFKIKSARDMEAAAESPADLILLDNGYGTGGAFNWNLVGNIGRKFALAGGLNIDNISEALRILKPYMVDVSSGVETERIKDEKKIKNIIEGVRKLV